MTRRALFRSLHLVWAVPGVTVPILLAAADGGHPPPIAYLPLALLVWLAGHAVLALAQHLVERGVEEVRAAGGGAPAWPWSVVLILVVSGLASALALLIVGRYLFEPDAVGTPQLLMLAWMALHVPCFVGVALRRGWARWYAAGTALTWPLLALYGIAETLRRGSPVEAWEWSVAVVVFAGFATLAWLLALGAGSRRYFRSSPASRRSR
ncbi:MAG: hypothetical protein R3244_09655 [Thermoanaerobaculia bacterium]|nr:hypothetical protein [Thermoanaerobaculia bacterium]